MKVRSKVKAAANWETVEVTTDLLILGGGMSACGT
jgi:hypothetical protein